jgi:hypothetical protein
MKHEILGFRARSLDEEIPARFAGHFNGDSQMVRRQQGLDTVAPFHQAHAVGLEILVSAEVDEFFRVPQAVGVEMIDRQAGLIFLDENECGATDPTAFGDAVQIRVCFRSFLPKHQ